MSTFFNSSKLKISYWSMVSLTQKSNFYRFIWKIQALCPLLAKIQFFSNISVTEYFSQNFIPVIINGQKILYQKGL